MSSTRLLTSDPRIRGVLEGVLSKFVRDLQPTPRKEILLKLKGLPNALEELKRAYLITARNTVSHEDVFLPTIRTFQEVADPEMLASAKRATGAVISVVQELFESSDEQRFAASKVKSLVTDKTAGSLSEREIDIGLYLSTEFQVFSSYNTSPNEIVFSFATPHESILHFTSVDEEWPRRLALFQPNRTPNPFIDVATLLDTHGEQFGVVDPQKEDWKFAEMAIEEARKSIPEDGRSHPLVGAVVVKNGVVLAKAYRGEVSECHAEYIALEKKLQDESVAGATVYTTLEPCTTRNHPKIPCAQRLVDRKVARVVIGMPDPNPQIRGLGDQLLSDAGIEIQMFPRELRAKVEEMNREFIRVQRQKAALRQNVPRLEHSSRETTPEMSALRPKVYPVRFGGTPDNRYGLFIRNDGETAFDLSVEDVSVGTAQLRFWSGLPVFTKDEGTVLIEGHIQVDEGTGTFANGLQDQMAKSGLYEVSLSISYRDADLNHYRTKCRLERNVHTKGGIATRYLGQEFVAPQSTPLSDLPQRLLALAKELQKLLEDLGPQREVTYHSTMSLAEFTKANEDIQIRERKMEAMFQRRFLQRVVDLYNEACETGTVYDADLEIMLKTRRMDNDADIKSVIERLKAVAGHLLTHL